MPKKISLEALKEKILIIHNGKVLIDSESYISSSKKCRFVDIDYGPWYAYPSNVIYKKTGHPKRGIDRRKKTKTTPVSAVKNSIKKLFGDLVIIDESTYTNLRLKARFVDAKYGEFWMSPGKMIDNQQRHPKYNRELTAIRSRLNIGDLKSRIFKVHGNTVSVDDSTYNGNTKWCRFIDSEYGEFWALPRYVVKKGQRHPKYSKIKHENSCIAKYGVRNPMQNIAIQKKSMKNQNQARIKRHWKTKKHVVCTGSYEFAVVSFLNKKRIDYEWQSRIFKMPNGKTYRPDLYLKKENKWIEIKGFFRKDAKEKWDWFHKENPNSELWNESKLKEMCIL